MLSIIGAKPRLHGLKHLPVDDGLVLAIVLFVLVGDLAGIDRVGEQIVKVASTEWPVAPCFVAGGGEGAGAQLAAGKFSLQFADAAELQVAAKDHPDDLGLVFIYNECPFLGAVAER